VNGTGKLFVPDWKWGPAASDRLSIKVERGVEPVGDVGPSFGKQFQLQTSGNQGTPAPFREKAGWKLALHSRATRRKFAPCLAPGGRSALDLEGNANKIQLVPRTQGSDCVAPRNFVNRPRGVERARSVAGAGARRGARLCLAGGWANVFPHPVQPKTGLARLH